MIMLPFSVLFYLKQSSPMYYAYVFFPIYFWSHSILNIQSLLDILRNYRTSSWYIVLFYATLYILGLECLVMTYHYREVIFVIFIFWGLWYSYYWINSKIDGALFTKWLLLCFVCGSFTLLSPQLVESIPTFVFGGFCHLAIGLHSITTLKSR